MTEQEYNNEEGLCIDWAIATTETALMRCGGYDQDMRDMASNKDYSWETYLCIIHWQKEKSLNNLFN